MRRSYWRAFALAVVALAAPIQSLSAHADGLTASYWNSTNFSGTPTTRVDPTINFDWGNNAPLTGVNTDKFSVRWTGQIIAPATGTFTFTTNTDDGVRLWVNSTLLVDKWVGQSATTSWTGTISLTAGQRYPIRMEFYEDTGLASAKLSWSGPGVAAGIIPSTSLLSTGGGGDGLSAAYFNGQNLGGTPVTRYEPTISFDWGTGSPATGINVDNFSARWTGQVLVPATGTYTFTTSTDDGVRLWVNNILLVDKWVQQAGTTWSGSIALRAGQKVPVKMEFFEAGGNALAKLFWSGPGVSSGTIPQGNLFSATDGLIGVNLAGAEFGPLPGVYGTNYVYPNANEMDYYKSKGRRVLRVPFKWERIQPTLNNTLSSAELSRMDVVVANASARGMLVLLDCHNYGRYLPAGSSTSEILGTTALPASAFADMWRRLAQHFAGSNAIFGYSLMNEPHDMGDSSRWPAAAQAAVTAIREVDSLHSVFVCGDYWSGAYSWRKSTNENLNIIDPANNLVYEAHCYFDTTSGGNYDATYESQGATPQTGVIRVQPFVEWCQAKGKRGFIGEFGVPANDSRWLTTMDNFLAYITANNIGGTYWAGGPSWPANDGLSIEPTNNFTVDKPQMGVLQNYPG